MEIEYKTKIGNIKFNSKNINGIIGNKLSDIEEIIKVDYESIDKIILDKKTLSKEDYNTLKRKISIVKKNDYLNIQIGTINELMEYVLKQKKISTIYTNTTNNITPLQNDSERNSLICDKKAFSFNPQIIPNGVVSY